MTNTNLKEQCQFVRNELTNIIGFVNTGIPAELGTLPDYIRNLRDECVPSDDDIEGEANISERDRFTDSDVCEAVSVLLEQQYENEQDSKGVTTCDVCKQLSLAANSEEVIYYKLCQGVACQELCIVGFDADAMMFGVRFHHA